MAAKGLISKLHDAPSVEAVKIVGQDACPSANLTGKELSFGSSTKGADLAGAAFASLLDRVGLDPLRDANTVSAPRPYDPRNQTKQLELS